MNRTLLVIEDSEDVRENMKELLELSGFKVLCASDGKEGLEMAQKNIPDIILCDVMMPVLDGYGVLGGLISNPKTNHIPFIFVTAKSEKEDLRKGMNLGADDYLFKPFNGADLLSLVNARLRKADALKEMRQNGDRELGSFFSETMPLENIYSISEKITAKKLKKKDRLYTENDSSKYLYFLVSGKIKVFRTNEQGKEYITQVHKERDFFGYSSATEASKHMDTAEAIEDSEVASILKQDFYQLLLANGDLYAKFITFISAELSETNDKLIQLAYNSARKRVAEAILYLARKYQPLLDDNITFPACRDDISAISGVSPESVSRNLTDFRTEHLIELQKGQIKILDLNKLITLKN